MIEKKIQTIHQGITVGSFTLSGSILPKARFQEEVNLEIFVSQRASGNHLMFGKIFKGRPPYYRPWIELFDIYPTFEIQGEKIKYFNSEMEVFLLSFFGEALEPGENLFVEYYRDRETLYQMQKNIPPPVTRLGYKLFRKGFSWFKDWYFPEGFMEGEQKLQGEKPLDAEAIERHRQNHHRELKSFVAGQQKQADKHPYIKNALDRAIEILENP